MPCHSLVQCHCSSSVASQSLWPEVQRGILEARKAREFLAKSACFEDCSWKRRNAAKSSTKFWIQADWMLQVSLYWPTFFSNDSACRTKSFSSSKMCRFKHCIQNIDSLNQSNPSKIMATETHLTAVQHDDDYKKALISPCFGVPSPDQTRPKECTSIPWKLGIFQTDLFGELCFQLFGIFSSLFFQGLLQHWDFCLSDADFWPHVLNSVKLRKSLKRWRFQKMVLAGLAFTFRSRLLRALVCCSTASFSLRHSPHQVIPQNHSKPRVSHRLNKHSIRSSSVPSSSHLQLPLQHSGVQSDQPQIDGKLPNATANTSWVPS